MPIEAKAREVRIQARKVRSGLREYVVHFGHIKLGLEDKHTQGQVITRNTALIFQLQRSESIDEPAFPGMLRLFRRLRPLALGVGVAGAVVGAIGRCYRVRRAIFGSVRWPIWRSSRRGGLIVARRGAGRVEEGSGFVGRLFLRLRVPAILPRRQARMRSVAAGRG